MSEQALRRARQQRDLERRVVGHVVGLVGDRSFVVPTTLGPKPAPLFQARVARWNRAAEVKKALVAAGEADFELQDAMPLGEGADVSLGRQVLLAFRQPVGHVRLASLPAWDDLATGRELRPLSADDVRRRVNELQPPGDKSTPGDQFGGPMTLILYSGSGFTPDARRVAREFVDGPPTILIEPNDAGGFTLTGPPAAKLLMAMLDPEAPEERQARVEAALEQRKVDLLTGVVPLDNVAKSLDLPVELVAGAATAWARRSGEALRVKAVDGVPTLYPDASASTRDVSSSATSSTISAMDRVRRLLGGNVSAGRRLAELAEQRAALSRQRDRQYDEMGTLEDRERQLRDAFAAETSTGARRRITSQLVQLQKDLDRRRETVGVINKQLNVVGMHLHNLELARTGSAAGKLPTADELADDAAKAEEVLADLEVTSELADELAGGHAGSTGLNAEEEALYQQLVADADAKQAADAAHAPADEKVPTFDREIPALRKQPTAPATPDVQDELLDEPEPAQPRRAAPEAEPG